MKSFHSSRNTVCRSVPKNLIIRGIMCEEMDTFVKDFTDNLKCPLNLLRDEPNLKLYKIKDKFICVLSPKLSPKVFICKTKQYLKEDSSFTFCSFINHNFNLSSYKKFLTEIKKSINLINFYFFSFETQSTLNQLNSFDVCFLQKNNLKPFFEYISSSHTEKKNLTNINTSSNHNNTQTLLLNKKRKSIFKIEKIQKTLSLPIKIILPDPADNKKSLPNFSIEHTVSYKTDTNINTNTNTIINSNTNSNIVKNNNDSNLNINEDSCPIIINNPNLKESLTPNKITVDLAAIKSDNEESENLNSRNSLISISKEVNRFIQSKGKTKGKDVTDHILNNLENKGSKLNYKNIQRRVYDAINVMSAIEIIKKEKGNIFVNEQEVTDKAYSSQTNPSSNEPNTNQPNQHPQNTKQTEEDNEIFTTIKNIENNRKKLSKEVGKYIFYKKFMELNRNDFKRGNSQDKLNFPFFIVKMKKDSNFEIKEVEFNNKVILLSDKPFKIMEPEQIMKYFIKKELIPETINKNISNEIGEYFVEHKLLDNYFGNREWENKNKQKVKEKELSITNKTDENELVCSSLLNMEESSISQDLFQENLHMRYRSGSEDFSDLQSQNMLNFPSGFNSVFKEKFSD